MARASEGRSSLSRAMQLLSAFDVNSVFLTVSQLSERTNLPLSTTHRLINDLVEHGLLERRENKSYRLGLRLWELASKTPGAVGLREIARPHLNAVHARIRQHTQLAVLDGREAVFLERLSYPQAVVNYTLIGGRLPLHASSSGLVLLAHAPAHFQESFLQSELYSYTANTVHSGAELRRMLGKVRTDGYVIGDGYIHESARGIAVPIRGVGDEVIAALGVVVPNDQTPTLPTARLLQAISRGISRDLLEAYAPAGDTMRGDGKREEFRMLVRSSEESMAIVPTIPKI